MEPKPKLTCSPYILRKDNRTKDKPEAGPAIKRTALIFKQGSQSERQLTSLAEASSILKTAYKFLTTGSLKDSSDATKRVEPPVQIKGDSATSSLYENESPSDVKKVKVAMNGREAQRESSSIF